MTALTMALAAVLVGLVPPAAQARYATGGTGTYLGSVDWFEWGSHGTPIPSGTTRTNTRTVAGQTLATTCTISNLSGSVNAYRPGSWGGDGLDDMYNIGGVGGSNQLVAGLSTAQGGQPSFHLACSVTLNGAPVPLAGLVMADAEQSGAAEFVQATIPAGAQWRLIDRHRTSGCAYDTTVTRTGQTLRLTGPTTICPTGPDGVAFMEGATSADVTLKGGGVSAIALGVMLFNDFGDAPAGYGDAGALYSPGFAGGVVPQGTSSLFGSALNTPTQPATRLGATVDSEGGSQSGAAAAGDGADEDAVTLPASVAVEPGTTYTLPGVACTGPGAVAGWMDWNRNGTFDTGERSGAPVCAGGRVDLTWSVPADAAAGPSYLRLRIGPDAASVASPTGMTTAGEVEDHAVSLAVRGDYGDAPDTAGTTSAVGGARHLVPDYDDATRTAPVMLGASVDLEDDGRPSPAADGDDTDGVDDEDGVRFNPGLGYANPTVRTGTDPVTMGPVTNHLAVDASAPGFVSVWVDWNQDGDLLDEGERVADAQPVTAGANDIAFTRTANPDDIRAHVRVRYSTDADALHDPTGQAPDGEVEDYRVLLERLVVPAACSPVTEPYHAMTFRSITDQTGTGGTGTSGRYPDVTVIDGEPVDVLIETVGGNSIDSRGFHTAGDDAAWDLGAGGGDVEVRYTFVRAGTTTPVEVNGVWTVDDMDAGEMVQLEGAALTGYAVTPGSKVTVSEEGALMAFRGTVSGDGGPESRFQIWFQGVEGLTSTWRGSGGAGFALDGDDDLPLPPSCDDYGDAPDSYGTTLAADGPHSTVSPSLRMGAAVEVDGDGQPTAGADGDDTNRTDDEDALAGPLRITTRETTAVTVTVTNDLADPATLAGWIDLDGNGTFDAGERVVVPVPAASGTAQYRLEFPAGSTTADTYARFRLQQGTIADPSPLGAGAVGEVEDHPVTVLTPALRVTKSSDATASSGPGDTVRYTVTLTNTGTGDFTTANPARVVDDLTDVLDDATYAGDATASTGDAPTYTEPRLSWSGSLGSGDSVTLSYSVTLEGGGDGTVRNVAWSPETGTPGPTPDCASSAMPCDTTTLLLPKLVVDKVADRTSVPADGEQLTYTLTVSNAGPGDHTAEHPARVTDDLTDVLDDASAVTVVSTSRGEAVIDGATLSWQGPLAAGESVTVVYAATYDDDRDGGDQLLVNRACVPADDALDPAAACASTRTPGSGLRQSKTVDPASGTAVVPGQELTYTLSFQNVGGADARVRTTDDLTGVLDDAVLLSGPDAEDGLTAQRSGETLAITGTVPAGRTLTVTYTVRVKDFAGLGDKVLRNALACPAADGDCEPAVTENTVRHLSLTKDSDATADAGPGDTVTYTVTLTNDGTADFTGSEPAVLVDDLTGVLDDATYNEDARADAGTEPTYTAPRIRWSGALAAGDAMTLTYTVTLAGGGDGTVRNVAWSPETGTPGPTPDCGTSGEPCATETFELPRLSIEKTVDARAADVGDVVRYTVTVTNTGPGDYTAAHPATFADDLAGVTDDTGPVTVVSAAPGDASVTGDRLQWSGVLAAGESATVVYEATYRATGDLVVENVACLPAEEVAAGAERCRSVRTPGSGLQQAKSVDPSSGSPVSVGQVVAYTLTFTNAGGADAAVDATDDLSGVLDDAVLVGDPRAEGLQVERVGDALRVTGTVPAGETRTVTYSVRVRALDEQGDHVLANALTCDPAAPACEPASTENPVRHLTVTKELVEPAGTPDTGDSVTYRVRLVNDGAADFTDAEPAEVVDDLSGVLDDARWNDDAEASSGRAVRDGDRLRWTGPLAAGEDVEITYSVTVTNLGDHRLENTATVPGCTDPVCTTDPVVTPLPHVVPAKTADPAAGTALQPGDVVTYTLTWRNDGEAAGVVDSTDDLAGVLDDAVLVGEPTVGSGGDVTATLDADELRVAGPIAVDETVTVSYQVRVRASGEQGDHELANVLMPDTPQVGCPDEGPCTPVDPPATRHPVAELDDWKSVDPASGSTVQAGARLTYTLHFASTGTAPVEVDRVDDLTGVLDDARLVTGPTASSPALEVSGPEQGRIAVTGTLPPGEQATVTYTVAVSANGERGDDRLGNYLLDPGQETPQECTGTDPERLDCTVNHVSDVEVAKTSSPADGAEVEVGDTIRYTLTFRNVAQNPAAAAAPVDAVDDLADVLDDADWAQGPRTGDPALRATRSGDRLLVTGDLEPGQEVTVTYAVTVTGAGDGTVRNVVGLGDTTSPCATGSPTCTTQAVADEHADGGGTPTGGADAPAGPDQGVAGLPDTGSPLTRWALGLGALSVLSGLVLLLWQRRRGRLAQ